jgi:hypothetical protein
MTEIDQIISDVMIPDAPEAQVAAPTSLAEMERRERLVGIAVAGKSKEYLGKSITSDEIANLDQKELLKLYARYEARMGGIVTKTMKRHFVTAYTNIVNLFLPKNLIIVDQRALEDSLNEGPFIELALSKWTCGLYHRFGHMLAPIEAALLTSNHLKKVPVEDAVEDAVDKDEV